MSLRFIHTGDVHIGAKFASLGKKGRDQREQIKDTFSQIIDYTIRGNYEVLLIAGDLFDNMNPSEYSISFVKRCLIKLNDAGIYAVVIPGTHDRLEENSVFSLNNFSDCGEKIYVFTDLEKESYVIPELDAVFYAKINQTSKSTKSPILDFKKLDSYQYHIALAHGSLQIEGKSSPDDYPITSSEISGSGMNYIALAHWHNTLDVSFGGVTSYYCGSPELVALDQKGSGNILDVTIEDTKVNVNPVKIGKRFFKGLTVDVGEINSLQELTGRILNLGNKDLVLNLELTGFWSKFIGFDIQKFTESIEKDFFYVNIVDKTMLSEESYDENTYPDDYLIGKFIRIVKDSDLDEIEKSEVLKYGVSLLEGKNIL